MSEKQTSAGLRLWPGVAIVVLQWLAVFGTGIVAPATAVQFFGMMGGPIVGILLFFLWWCFASRAPRLDRVLGFLLPLLAFAAAFALADRSAKMAVFVYGIPIFCLAFVVAAYLTRQWPHQRRRLALVAVTLVAAGVWTLLRSEGVDGAMGTELAWRWQATAEERLLASGMDGDLTASRAGTRAEVEAAEWPGFRGAARDGLITGLRVATDWSVSPPEEIWRRPVGPGWGSFAVAGDRLYTQEQRGEDELVTAYRASTGEPIWMHRDPVRFWEALAGAGPRATPTLADGRVYTFGATGILNVLEASDGARVWSRDVAAETGAPTPEWGFSSSPLVIDGLVIVFGGAADGKAVAAYDAATGEPRWFAPAGPRSYSSLHPASLAGIQQLILLTNAGASGLSPADGTVLWEHVWQVPQGGTRIVQPAFAGGGGVLIGTGFGQGVRRIAVEYGSDGWQIEERWTSRGLKPYYNDFVVNRSHVYGFDGRILACLDLETGERAWKGGRYGNGQLVLLNDQDLLLVLSERGEVALVAARPDGWFSELARMPAIEGKTWNHPVIADGVLYVRNGEEMAAFRLPVESTVAALTPRARSAGLPAPGR